VSDELFVSHGQNHEDVVLWRALKSLRRGRYVEVGANDPLRDSISRSFYDAGWNGLLIEPEPDFAARLREARPRDIVIEAAAATVQGPVTLHRFRDTGLSTLDDSVRRAHDEQGWDGEDLVVMGRPLGEILQDHGYLDHTVHFAVIDVEGAEGDVLASVDLGVWRPWVLVVESTLPNSNVSTHAAWEQAIVDANYEFCLFDGVSRFYVATERAAEFRSQLGYPACVLDRYVDYDMLRKDEALRDAMDETQRWRHAALGSWATGVSVRSLSLQHSAQVAELNQKLRRARRQASRARKTATRARKQLKAQRSGGKSPQRRMWSRALSFGSGK
jgi:FkbM family methyltransferase